MTNSRLESEKKPFRILSLDGGGAKGVYSIGVLREIEALADKRLHEVFDLIYGTSTGAIIASLLAKGLSVEEIYKLYMTYVPKIMQKKSPLEKSKALAELADEIFGKSLFDTFKTNVGVVTTKWLIERPMIFKGTVAQAHGRKASFQPGFGVPISHAVQASCSAYPFFKMKTVKTSTGEDVQLVDGGYCANNPTLYAIADAISAMELEQTDIRVISVGVGNYPEPKAPFFSLGRWIKYLQSVQLLQKTLEINTQSMDQLRAVLYKKVKSVRISDTFSTPDMATNLFEHDLSKLNILHQRGRESFALRESDISNLISE